MTTVLERGTTLRRRLLIADGLFLGLVGGLQLVFEMLSYHAGVGPLNTIFQDSHYMIGWVEAHGLAFLIGVLLLTVGQRDGRRFWHAFALAVHVLLGGANLYFWSSFGYFDMVPMGIAATTVHGLLVLGNAIALRRS